MSHSAAYFADHAQVLQTTIHSQRQLAENTFGIKLACPQIARQVIPGQFVMLRLAGMNDPLLARPLAVYDLWRDATGELAGIELVYLVVGKLTSRLAHIPAGTRVDIWGPLGNGFARRPCEQLIMVAGGIGQTPFLLLGKEYLGGLAVSRPAGTMPAPRQVLLLYGARSVTYLAGVEEFESAGIEVRVSTDDGTAGHRGLVTDLLRAELATEFAGRREIACCGPEKMLEAVSHIALNHAVPLGCQVSLETPMACGIGICFSCVTRVKEPDGTWDYRRTCVEGPIFEAERLAW
ncbi:MAG: dihydroorotate dehydrogenase electron transfer subunit [Pirellulales bacterium]|nr:dihydroorotate dehydrogenase electron transfer subunit [Pirellulales bacterium]